LPCGLSRPFHRTNTCIGLNSLNDALGYLVLPERNQNLMQNKLIEHFIASVGKASCKGKGMGTTVFD